MVVECRAGVEERRAKVVAEVSPQELFSSGEAARSVGSTEYRERIDSRVSTGNR